MKKVLLLVTGLLFANAALSADWVTSYKNDEMRGTAQKFAQSESDNAAEFEFPYNGGSKLVIVLRSKKTELRSGQKAEDLPLTEAMLIVTKGQFSCNSFDDCHISVKFDNNKIQTYSMSESSDASTDVIFFDNSSSFIKNINSHKIVILEANFFQEGAKQFKFDFSGVNHVQS